MEKDEKRELVVPCWMGWVIGGACVWAVVWDLLALGRPLSGGTTVVLGYLVALVAIPFVDWIRVGPTGFMAKTVREEREKAEVAAERAELAERVAHVYYSVIATVLERWGMGKRLISFVKLLAFKAMVDEPVTVGDMAELYGGPSDPLIGDYREVFEALEHEGLAVVSGDGERLQARIVPDYRKAIVKAFSHYD